VAVSFIGGGDSRKLPLSTPHHVWDSNSPLEW